MKKATRRAVLIQGALLPMLGCGGGRDAASDTAVAGAEPAANASPASSGSASPARPPTVSSGVAGRYRNQHTHLLQGTSWNVQAARVAGGTARVSSVGPSAEHVDAYSGWPWERKGGDWIDANGTRWGPAPWASLSIDAGVTLPPRTYSGDVSSLLRRVQTENRWCAFRVAAIGANPKIAGLWNPDQPAPALEVVYGDGSREVLTCTSTSVVKSGVPDPVASAIPLPAFIEFDRPRKLVQSARFLVTVILHGSSKGQIVLYLLDPPLNSEPVRVGVAESAGSLDSGILDAPGIIGAHRYIDGSTLAQFAASEKINTWASREFDPALWGGEPNLNKLPHKHLGKFVSGYGDEGLELVPSTFAGEGFQPLSPRLGALRLHMPATAKADGDIVGYGGTGAANTSIFMPERLFGRLPGIFVRQYVRLGTPEGDRYLRHPKDRLHVYHGPNQVGPAWTDWGGKWGITPDHTSSYGGTSGSAGGGNGWQMRLAWSDSDANFNGPNDGGMRVGFHLFDFGVAQPSGHNYSGESGSRAYWGQRGGLGGILYANTWYCVETELKLNTVMDTAPGFRADGELRAWVDGRLVFERIGMVFRTKPLAGSLPPSPATMPPLRDLGVRALWLNWFHGGVTQNTVPRTMFITGLAYGTQYIGPMRLQ